MSSKKINTTMAMHLVNFIFANQYTRYQQSMLQSTQTMCFPNYPIHQHKRRHVIETIQNYSPCDYRPKLFTTWYLSQTIHHMISVTNNRYPPVKSVNENVISIKNYSPCWYLSKPSTPGICHKLFTTWYLSNYPPVISSKTIRHVIFVKTNIVKSTIHKISVNRNHVMPIVY